MIDNADLSRSTIRLLVFQALKAYPTGALHALIDDEDCLVRSAVARELQMRGEASTFEFIVDLKSDARDFVREICAFTLGQLGTPGYPFRTESIPILIGLASDESEEVRAAAISGLGHISANEAVETLINAASDASPTVRASAAGALGSVDATPEVMRAVRALLHDEHSDVREWAEVGLELLSGNAQNDE